MLIGRELRRPSKLVAVVVPLSNRAQLSPDEEISLRHCREYLGRYDRYVLAPRSLTVSIPDFRVVRLADRYFGSVRAHTHLMLSPQLYERFRDYEYILTYHLDALALSDQLEEWCGRELDFIGAANHGPYDDLRVVCNGGFALRKVESFLQVFRSREYAVDPERYWAAFAQGKSWPVRLMNLPRRYLKRLHYFNNIRREMRLGFRDPEAPLEDVFFVQNATKYHPAFRLPTVAEALRFAFDEAPRKAFAMNGFQLPFGAHAWYKQDRAFWEPHLLA